jgi:uncharacterized protein (DUF1501 family)
VDGDLAPTQDFRGLYSTLLGDWMGIDEREVMPREFEKPAIISSAAHS